MSHCAVGLADLLVMAKAMSADELVLAYASAGYVPVPVPARRADGAGAADRDDAADFEDTQGLPPPPAAPQSTVLQDAPGLQSQQTFWRVRAIERKNPDEMPGQPDWLQNIKPATEADLTVCKVPRLAGIEPAPLLRPARFATFLRSHVARRVQGRELDVDRLCRQLARGRVGRQLPRRTEVRWPQHVSLVVDNSPTMRPLHDDVWPLAEQARRLLGLRLDVLTTEAGPHHLHDHATQRRVTPSPDGRAVLVLGDLGVLTPQAAHASHWSAWMNGLAASGAQTLALLPLTREHLPAAVRPTVHMALLGTDNRLRLARPVREREHGPDAEHEAEAQGVHVGKTAVSARRQAPWPQADASIVSTLLGCVLANPCVSPSTVRALRQLLHTAGLAAAVHHEPQFFQHPWLACSGTLAALRAMWHDEARALFVGLPPPVRAEAVRIQLDQLAVLSPVVRAEYIERLLPQLAADDLATRELLLQARQDHAELYRKLAAVLNADPARASAEERALRDAACGFLQRFGRRSQPVLGQIAPELRAAWALAHRDELRSGRTALPPGVRLDELAWVIDDPRRALAQAALVLHQRADPGRAVAVAAADARWELATLHHPLSLVAGGVSVGSHWTVEPVIHTTSVAHYLLDVLALYVSTTTESLRPILWAAFEAFVTSTGGSGQERAADAASQWSEAVERAVWRAVSLPQEQALALAALCQQVEFRGLSAEQSRDARLRLIRCLLKALPADWCAQHSIAEPPSVAAGALRSLADSVRLRVPWQWHILTTHASIVVEPFHKPAWARRVRFDAGVWRALIEDGRWLSWVPAMRYEVLDGVGAEGYFLTQGAWCEVTPDLPNPGAGVPARRKPAWAARHGVDEFGYWAEFEVRSDFGHAVQRLRFIPPGEFFMGSPGSESERFDDETQHQVVLAQGYWLADTACSQALWQAVMGDNPSNFNGDPANPVEQVSWQDITDNFLPALNRLVPELDAVLPTEAQWENACRAGTTTPFSFGEQITPAQVNYNSNKPYENGANSEYRRRMVPVKSLPANGWGLYEMHGNVLEWCQDGPRSYEAETAIDPVGPRDEETRKRVRRGGSWNGSGKGCRSAYRSAFHPDARLDSVGFRLARGLDDQQEGQRVRAVQTQMRGALAKIYISHASDSHGYSDPIIEHLNRAFGKGRVITNAGANFPSSYSAEEIESQIAQCSVLIMLVGPDWLNIRESRGNSRNAGLLDSVRSEVRFALKLRLQIITVLVDGVSPLNEADLPTDLSGLTNFHAIRIGTTRPRVMLQGLDELTNLIGMKI